VDEDEVVGCQVKGTVYLLTASSQLNVFDLRKQSERCGMTSIQRFIYLRDSCSFHCHLRETKMMVRAGLVMTRQNAVSRRASRVLSGMGEGERSSRVSGVEFHLVLFVYRSEIAVTVLNRCLTRLRSQCPQHQTKIPTLSSPLRPYSGFIFRQTSFRSGINLMSRADICNRSYGLNPGRFRL
jgi:hypothetical protein